MVLAFICLLIYLYVCIFYVCSCACILMYIFSYLPITLLPCQMIFNFFFFVQVTFSLLFSLVIAFISDALSAVPDKASILSHDASFRKEFHETVRGTMICDCILIVDELLIDNSQVSDCLARSR